MIVTNNDMSTDSQDVGIVNLYYAELRYILFETV